jgi:hypothetical protein
MTDKIEQADLERLEDLVHEVKRARSIVVKCTEAAAELNEWGTRLPGRWAATNWSTEGLDTSIAGLVDEAQSLQIPEGFLERLEAIIAAADEARAVGEAAAAVGATGNSSAFTADDTAGRPALSALTGAESPKPTMPNAWGGADAGARVQFHDDGPYGRAIRSMGPDARMDVDGEPLVDVLGVLATEVVRGQRTAQDALDAVEQLRDRIPTGSRARDALDRLIATESAPSTPAPAVPDGTPAYLARLVADLHAVPMVRRDTDRELKPLLQLVDDVAAGRMVEGRRLLRDLENLTDKRHDSLGDVGKFEIDRAVQTATQALRDQLTARTAPPATGDQR